MRRIEVDLSPDEQRRELEHIVKYERDARMGKRAQALLWLNEGEKITVITHRLQVRRQRYTTGGRCIMHEIKSP